MNVLLLWVWLTFLLLTNVVFGADPVYDYPYRNNFDSNSSNVSIDGNPANGVSSIMACSSDNFFIRPASLTLSASESADSSGSRVGGKPPGHNGSLTVTAVVADWLKFNWLGAEQVNPVSVASFGLYKGNQQQIYFQEVY